MLLDPEVKASTVLLWMVDNYGPEVFDWHPQTLHIELRASLGENIPEAVFDKLMAAIVIASTDLYFKDVLRFIHLSNVLAGEGFNPVEIDIADPSECAWGVTEAMLLNPPEEGEPYWSDDVRFYISSILKLHGFLNPPEVLRSIVGPNFQEDYEYYFSEDPDLFNMMNDVQTSRKREIDDMIVEELIELRNQIRELPLQNGDTAPLVEKIDQFTSARP